MAAWQDMVRRRLLAGEELDGPTIRRDVGRRVPIYTFLRNLDENEGWIFKQRLTPSRHLPMMRYKLVGFRTVAPNATGPRCNLPPEERPTEIVRRRFLSGEELENKTVAEELGCTASVVTYVKRQIAEQGYEVVTRREGYRVFTRVKKRRRKRSSR